MTVYETIMVILTVIIIIDRSSPAVPFSIFSISLILSFLSNIMILNILHQD